MKRLIALLACALSAFVLSASASAAVYSYAGSHHWPAGQPASSYFSSSWFQNVFYKTSSFESVLTFIDNASYGWHSTVRGPGSLETHWLSSQVKKAHCKALATGHSWAACTVYS
jgi:hypothetical protein